MQLHEFTIKKKQKKRRGRGGKRGTYSGRGQKGQKSRAGRRIRPALRDLLIRIPKLRGFKNKPLKDKPVVLSIADLAKLKGTDITIATLKEAHVLSKNFGGTVKILGTGTIGQALNVKGIDVSSSARKAIEAAGGSISK